MFGTPNCPLCIVVANIDNMDIAKPKTRPRVGIIISLNNK